jgi:hypothetical protein
MEPLPMFLEFAPIILPLYLVPAAIGTIPALLFLKRRGGTVLPADWLVLIIPPVVWLTAMVLNGSGKSLSNLVEAVYLGGCASVIAILRVALCGRRRSERTLSTAFLVAICLAGLLLWAFVPGLPE